MSKKKHSWGKIARPTVKTEYRHPSRAFWLTITVGVIVGLIFGYGIFKMSHEETVYLKAGPYAGDLWIDYPNNNSGLAVFWERAQEGVNFLAFDEQIPVDIYEVEFAFSYWDGNNTRYGSRSISRLFPGYCSGEVREWGYVIE